RPRRRRTPARRRAAEEGGEEAHRLPGRRGGGLQRAMVDSGGPFRHTDRVANRPGNFPDYIAPVDAGAGPARAIGRGPYVASARALADRVRPRIELEPHSTHLLTGGVGSGKTTQLLVMRDAIANLPDTTVIYIDVTRKQDLELICSGVLLLLAGLELS